MGRHTSATTCVNRKATKPLDRNAIEMANAAQPRCNNYAQRKRWMDVYIAEGGKWECKCPKNKEVVTLIETCPAEEDAQLTVRVFDHVGNVVHGATVTVSGLGGSFSDENGVAEYGMVAPGSYEVTAEVERTSTGPDDSAGTAVVFCTLASNESRVLDLELIQECPSECPVDVRFTEKGGKWGWDDLTDGNVPWISIQTGKSDTVVGSAKVTSDSSKMCNVVYESSDPSVAKVSPNFGSADGEVVTISGVKKGEATVVAKCDGHIVGKMKVAVKNLMRKKMSVRLIHETNYTSTDCSNTRIEKFLKKTYKQALIEFSVTRLPAKTIAFDLDGSGTFKVTGPWPGPELRKIINEAADPKYDMNVFIVDNPDDQSLGWADFKNVEKSCVAHLRCIGRRDGVATEKTIAHEGGHGIFGLRHPSDYPGNPAHLRGDKTNLMKQGDSLTLEKLRKYQWDLLNR